MSGAMNKKLAEILGKMDGKVLQIKLNTAIDLLKKGEFEELARKINNMEKNELLDKINEFDESKLKELGINKDEIKQKISPDDFDRLTGLIGEQGDEIVEKIKDIIK